MSTKNNWRRWLEDETDLPSIEKIPHRSGRSQYHASSACRNKRIGNNAEFKCCRCNAWVNTDPALSGVQHRNHCPYCLHSRHLDAVKAGDRLSGCQAAMRPIGLTLKPTRNKYAREESGELMLIHHCLGCGKLSINRIAADDNAESMLVVFDRSADLPASLQAQIASQGIRLLGMNDLNIILTRLYGAGMAIEEWIQVKQPVLDHE